MDMNYSTTPIYRKDGTVHYSTVKSPLVIINEEQLVKTSVENLCYMRHIDLDIAGNQSRTGCFWVMNPACKPFHPPAIMRFLKGTAKPYVYTGSFPRLNFQTVLLQKSFSPSDCTSFLIGCFWVATPQGEMSLVGFAPATPFVSHVSTAFYLN